MWTLIILALAALLWLVQVTLGAEAAGAAAAADPAGLLGGAWLRHAALGFSVLAIVMVLQRVLTHALGGTGRSRQSATSDLLRAVLTISLYLLASMLYLRFGLQQDISSVLATSAMLSVIIGLALQPTLGHLFAGVSIEIERPLRVGDFVRRDELEGQVVSLNWRSVYLRTERGSTVVMPNSEFTSRTIEVIPSEQPFRHQMNFSIASSHPPGQVIRIALAVLRSDLPGLCSQPGPSVVVLGNDPVTGTLRYTARFFTLQFLDRSSLASNFLERLWYALSREGLALLTPPSAWHPASEDSPGTTDDRLRVHPLFDDPGGAMDWEAHASPELAQARPRLGAEPPLLAGLPADLRRALLEAAQPLRFGRFERCDGPQLALLQQGRLQEDRLRDPVEVERDYQALVQALELALTGSAPGSAPRRANPELYAALQGPGSLALGPLAHNLSEQLCALTTDPALAFRAFAAAIPDESRRMAFLANAPGHSRRRLGPGDWLGTPWLLGLEPEPPACLALQGSTLLRWPAERLRPILRHCSDADRLALVQDWQGRSGPGGPQLELALLQRWLAAG